MSLSKENDLQMMEQNAVLLLIGKTGSGKSATGNTIFGRRVFESEMRSSSVTRVCQTHTDDVHNRRVTVIDTPDFIFSTHTDFDSDSELKRALSLCSPGAHAILLLLSLNTFTEQEMEFIAWFEQKFGEEALRFTLVLFTHADQKHMRSLGEMIRGNTKLSQFNYRCGQRFHEFNIKAPANRRQVTELMEKIDRLRSVNTNSCYTLDMMMEIEKRRQEEREYKMTLDRVRRETEALVRREYEQEFEEKRRRAEEEMRLERVSIETDMNGRRGYEAGTREKHQFIKRIKLKYVCVIILFAVVTGGVLAWKKEASHGWMFTKGFITGGSASTTGVFTGMFWRLLWKCPFIHSSSHERPSTFVQLLLKTAGVLSGLSAGALIGLFVGGNETAATVSAALAGAAGALTSLL